MKASKMLKVGEVIGDWFDAITDLAQMLGLGVKTPPPKEGGKPNFQFHEHVVRKIPWRFLGMLKDEVVWHNIERQLTDVECVIMDGWLKYLAKQQKNNDLTYFFAKSREDLEIDEVVDMLRKIYLEVAKEAQTPEKAYKLMTEKAINRNILKEAKFSKILKEKVEEFGRWVVPFSNKAQGAVVSTALTLKKVWDKSTERGELYADELEKKLKAKRKKREQRKGWFK